MEPAVGHAAAAQFASEAVAAARDGHMHAAQALAASGLGQVLHVTLRFPAFGGLGEAYQKFSAVDIDEATISVIKMSLIQLATAVALADTDDAGHDGFNRRGTHHGTREFFCAVNSLAGPYGASMPAKQKPRQPRGGRVSVRPLHFQFNADINRAEGRAMSNSDITHGALVGAAINTDDDFRQSWERNAPARLVAVKLIEYRSGHELSQSKLAEILRSSSRRWRARRAESIAPRMAASP